MPDYLHQPRDYDAVLGSSHSAPVGAVILGGMDGVKRRLASAEVESRIAGLNDASNYGKFGLDLIIQALNDESEDVQRLAYLLLRNRTEPQATRALLAYIPYRLFNGMSTVKAGQEIAISPDGNRIVYWRGKTIRVWDLQKQELLYTIPKYPKAREFFALSQNVKTLVRVRNGGGNVIEIWHQEELYSILYGHDGEIGAIAISPDGQTIASGSQDKTIKIWHLETRKLICTFGSQLTLGAHTAEILSLAFSADGKTLVSSARDGKIKLWDLRNRTRPRTLQGYANSVAINPDGLTLASSNWHNQIQLWNLSNQTVEHTLTGHFYSVNALVFSPYGRVLVSGGNDKSIHFWDVQTGDKIQTLTGHTNTVDCLRLSEDGQRLVSGGSDKTVKVWSVSREWGVGSRE
ncbi:MULTISPECIES: WD40 repeat domain-containing protein [unclassified Coleofasciculus]|uniref:WD40 repeat domain-containing protein n=1 Tax=unclassified Coleofasciculus TaxID=2692782 RepID=UPI001882C3E4|nr:MULTISPECIES: WD40 repeat domain-containing protein [unclassified Coleofasciculus]MBE9129869.1 WD40 repeat domain-containing protein [Coleofasciculus sp. LEGE 07081]MBE9147897.1 WD40 repeat domain-containing protein [Coleofasciculus sp. LEGE 07092]